MPEKQNVEWKVKWKDEYLEWICGFANAQGGKIYIGCDDNGTVIGVTNSHKLFIANCGCIPENWILDNLMGKHASKPYNPSIANVFYLAGFIESWGRGIEKNCGACKSDGVPEPKYMINPGDIMIEFTAPEDLQSL